jgi:hypothetical protein
VSGWVQDIDVAGAGLDSKQSTSSMTDPGWNGPQAVVVRWNAMGSACKNMIHRSEGRPVRAVVGDISTCGRETGVMKSALSLGV